MTFKTTQQNLAEIQYSLFLETALVAIKVGYMIAIRRLAVAWGQV